MDPLEVMSREEVSRALGRTPRTLYTWQRRGYGPIPFKVGAGRGRVAYWAADIRQFLASERDRAIEKIMGEDGDE